jgi:hypothetical protein
MITDLIVPYRSRESLYPDEQLKRRKIDTEMVAPKAFPHQEA